MDNIWSGRRQSQIDPEDAQLFYFPCTVKHKLSDSYGKWGKNFHEELIVMEFNEYLPYVTSYI